MMTRSYCIGIVLLVVVNIYSGAQEMVLNRGFASVSLIFDNNCSACHPGIETYEGIGSSGWVEKGLPEKSKLYLSIDSGSMPPGGPLTDSEKTLVRSWISDGATDSQDPLPVSNGSIEGGEPQVKPGGINFTKTIQFHKVSGFTSASLLLAAGAVGAAQWITLINDGHTYRDAHGIDEDQISSECAAYIMNLWSDPTHKAIRWIHIGLLSSGELLYLANTVTGIGLLSGYGTGLTPRELHRYAFFAHGSLMIAEVIMGFLTTSVLSRGSHEQMIAFGAAHSALGIAIPLVVIASGIAITTASR